MISLALAVVLAAAPVDPHYDATMPPAAALDRYLADLRADPKNDIARTNVVRLARTVKPPVPAEVDEIAGRGAAILGEAQTPADFERAAAEFRKAIALAPWIGDFYNNAAVVEEKANEPDLALHDYRFYLLCSPDADDAAEVRRKVGALEVAAEKKARVVRAFADLEGERWVAPDKNAGAILFRHGVLYWAGKNMHGVYEEHELGPLDPQTLTLDVPRAVLDEHFALFADWQMQLDKTHWVITSQYTSRLVGQNGRREADYRRNPFHPFFYGGLQYGTPVQFKGILETFGPDGQTIARTPRSGKIDVTASTVVGIGADTTHTHAYGSGLVATFDFFDARFGSFHFTDGPLAGQKKTYSAFDLVPSLYYRFGFTSLPTLRVAAIAGGGMLLELPLGLKDKFNGQDEAINRQELLVQASGGLILGDAVMIRADVPVHLIGEFDIWKQGPRVSAMGMLHF